MAEVRRIPPLVPEHAPATMKVALLPLLLPLVVFFVVADVLIALAEHVWMVLRGE